MAATCAKQGPVETICDPGTEIFCRCKGGAPGTKLCSDDGTFFSECRQADGNCPESPQTGAGGFGPASASASAGTGGACIHDPCVQGKPLQAACSSCATAVCAKDAFCCTNRWDQNCVGEVGQICGAGFCGGATTTGTATATASTTATTTGIATVSSTATGAGGMGSATATGAGGMGSVTATGAGGMGSVTATGAGGMGSSSSTASSSSTGGGGCLHSECVSGDKLDAMCSACAGAVCANDSFCCSTLWDSICAGEAKSSVSCPNCK